MTKPRKLFIAIVLASLSSAASAAGAAAPPATEITAVTVFGKLPKRVSETVRRLDASSASSCAYFRTNGHADAMLDSYINHFHGSGTNPDNHIFMETDLEGRVLTQSEGFRDTSPMGDASRTPAEPVILTESQTEQREYCGPSDRYSAAGRNYIARKDTSLDSAFAAHEKGDYPAALRHFKTAYTKLGTDEAALMLGHMHLYGQGGAPDTAQAIVWYTRLANARRRPDQYSRYNPKFPEQGTPRVEALLRLARIYANGYQVSADAAKARGYYQAAVDLNHIPAHVGLAGMLLAGAGGARDANQAAALLTTAAEHGYAPAQTALARLYNSGAGVAQDPAKAFGWFQQAAFNPRPDARKPHAQYALALMYDQGKGVAPDPLRALAFYKLSAVAGHPGAQNALATYFYEGQLVTKDPAIARKLFIAAAAQGQPDAMANAAAMLFRGEGGGKDLVQAYVWLRLAEKLGNDKASAAAILLEQQLTAEQKRQAEQVLKPG